MTGEPPLETLNIPSVVNMTPTSANLYGTLEAEPQDDIEEEGWTTVTKGARAFESNRREEFFPSLKNRFETLCREIWKY